MAIDTFWTTQNSGAYDPVLDETLGDTFDAPHSYLADALSNGTLAAQLASDAAQLYPVFDGETNVLAGQPDDFASPTAESFLNWHTGHQLAWLKQYGTERTVDGLTVVSGSFAGGSPAAQALTVVLSQDGASVITLNTLTPERIATLSLDDQKALAGMAEFRAIVADTFNLAPATADGTSDQLRTEIKTVIQSAASQIAATSTYTPGARATFLADPSSRGDLYHYLFTEQLELLSDRLDGMAIFDIDKINLAVADILERFTRLERYKTMTPEVAGTVNSFANSTDGGAAVAAAAELFLTIETRIYDTQVQSRDLSSSGEYNGRDVDAPGLIFLFQTFATYASEAKADAKTEELNQNNKLLEDYARLQELLNDTLNAFSEAGAAAEVGLGGVSTLAELEDLAAGNALILAMFDTGAVNADTNTMHPSEAEQGLNRPTLPLISSDGSTLVPHSKEDWNAFATNIGEMTTLIGQDSEVRMAEVTELGETKNRQYQLGSNVLNKMTNIIRSIIHS
ncbi:hypothetical protein [Phaeobacter sp. HF9A]|uniref:hypothetical protein n=1 Tax=Phaeobacter sp. HF9A TaxID=2721561 RepID=UPI0014322B01|nr:hypothetical protein [Phaeobacter sp. HF9A]NIZ11993.1 hypothetical protein [Phaeobacter sp. HF9A]